MWKIHFSPSERRLSIHLVAEVGAEQLHELAIAHARALESTAGQPFKVFIDVRGLFPMEPEAVTVLAEIKRVAASVEGCSGMVILADSPTVAMQQHRTRQKTRGGREAELITLDPNEATRFLAGEGP
jgi:hypothetical protein